MGNDNKWWKLPEYTSEADRRKFLEDLPIEDIKHAVGNTYSDKEVTKYCMLAIAKTLLDIRDELRRMNHDQD